MGGATVRGWRGGEVKGAGRGRGYRLVVEYCLLVERVGVHAC